ncbi:GUN4 domain-containing protein [Anabaena cylindrica FACHB-243]|nr:GUN4 domain-containing protein [Anabaena cylindrica FACHB-243]
MSFNPSLFTEKREVRRGIPCDLLAQRKWKEADEETRRVMLAVTKRENDGWLEVYHIDNFPCEDLSLIIHFQTENVRV